MDKIVIRGGKPLAGAGQVRGAKNAALPLMAAGLLTDDRLVLSNVPRLADIHTMSQLLSQHGIAGVSMRAVAQRAGVDVALLHHFFGSKADLFEAAVDFPRVGAEIAARDATAVARLRAAGGIVLGKTNTPEFALWWETGNRVYGTTVNPWARDRTAGVAAHAVANDGDQRPVGQRPDRPTVFLVGASALVLRALSPPTGAHERVAPSVPHGRQPAQAAQREAVTPRRLVPLRQGDVRQPLYQRREDQLGLQPCQLCAEAMVNAAAERQRPDMLAADVEAVRIGILRRVAVGRPQQGDHAFVNFGAVVHATAGKNHRYFFSHV